MPAKRSTARTARSTPTARRAITGDVRAILADLERRGTAKDRAGMARYGIVSDRIFGVSVAYLHRLAKRYGRDHDLAMALWDSGWYEARMLAAFVDEPECVTAAQMDRQARAFDNWAICDTLCMHLYDRTPHAWRKVESWSRRREEFVKRAAFALLASLARHDRAAPDAPFRRALALVEREAGDPRNFVKKAVSWALRAIGRRSAALHTSATALAKKLAAADSPAARWVGRDALRDLARFAARRRAKGKARTRADAAKVSETEFAR